MGYIVVGEVKDDGVSKKAQTLLGGLAHTISYNASSHSRKHEYRHLISSIQKFVKEVGGRDFDQTTAEAIKYESTRDIDKYSDKANNEIDAISQAVETNKDRQKYIHKELTKAGYFDFRNRSFKVASYVRSGEEYRKLNPKNPEKKYDVNNPVWIIDNEAVANTFIEDFKQCLPDSVPQDAFSYQLLSDNVASHQKGDALLVAFSEAYEDEVKEAFVKMVDLNVERMKGNNDETYLDLEVEGKICDEMSYKDAERLAVHMPYVIETEGTLNCAGQLTIEALRASNPSERMKEVELQEQFPLLNIEKYAQNDKRLKDFMDEPFGGGIGKTENGYRKAMTVCMGHYADELGKEINIDKVLSAIDREMNSGKKGPEVGISR